MRQFIKKVSSKLGFLAAITLAAIVGGVSTGVVMASIPDSNGDLNTCYATTGGSLRVIDTDTDTCTNDETAFKLSQDSSTAYFRVKNEAIDTAALRNITDFEWYDGTGVSPTTGYCLQLPFEPATGFSHQSNIVMVPSLNINNDLSGLCASNFNAFIQAGSPVGDADAWFSN